MNPKNFFAELKRRNVYKVAVAYLVAGWALAQGIAQVLPVFDAPNWLIRLLVVLIIIGLPIALAMAWAFESTPEGIKRTEEADAMPAEAVRAKRAWIYVAIVGGLLSIGLFYVGRYTAATKQNAGGSAKSIAVLPFENLSDDKQNTYFADGVQDQILNNLAKVSDLKVISHTSARQYKSGIQRNLREIGRQLGVAYVVEGSVQRAGDRLRINAQLIDARTDAHIWAETYDRTAADLFAIQSELAEAIVAQLKAKLSPKQKAEIEERPTQDLVAFDLYLQAKQIVDSYLVAEDVRAALLKALQSLDEAIRRDEKFVAAYCYAARANDLLYFLDLDPTQDRILLAETAVNAALRLRDDSAEAHFAIFCSDAVATTIARWKSSQSHGPLCRIARHSSSSPATSLAAVIIGLRPSEIFPQPLPSIREIPTLTTCWLILTSCNGDFRKRCRPTTVSWMQVSRRPSFGSVGHRHSSMELGIQNHCAKPWPARRTWT